MARVRVATISLNQTPLDWKGNEARIRQAVLAAREQGAELLCFPELCLSGYGAEDAFHWPDTARRSLRLLENLKPLSQTCVLCFGLPLEYEGKLYNVLAVLAAGRLCGFVAKQHLAADGVHYESRWFQPWPRGQVVTWSAGQQSAPLGDLLFAVGGVRFGVEICEDAWVKDRPPRSWGEGAVNLILNASASHFALGKHERRRALVQASAREFSSCYAYVNLVGNEAGRIIYDGDAFLVDAEGRIAAQARRFSFTPFQITVAELDCPQLPDQPVAPFVVELPLSLPLPSEAAASGSEAVQLGASLTQEFSEQAPVEPWTSAGRTWTKAEEFGCAVALGLFDYLRKTHGAGFVVSLSGGVDSASVVVLVRLMVRLGVEELGLAGLWHALGRMDPCPADEEGMMSQVLVTVYQSTSQSSQITREAAQRLAEALGCEHHSWDVDELVQGFRSRVELASGRELGWASDDLALQNIQARARAPGVWLLANVRRMLLLSTSNRSESAVGYTTMDGDTAGGLSPLAGIDKAYLRRWLSEVEEAGLLSLPPLPALHAVNVQAPTAELRPLSSSQTDEADLMPYDVLDVIERLMWLQRKPPREVLQELVARFPHHTREELRVWCSRFYRLFARNQWKRERLAPSFHLDDLNLDSRSWCRFPILSGGFEAELEECE